MDRRITVAALLLAMAAGLLAGCGGSGPTLDVDQAKKIAGELRDNKLYAAAINEYTQILDRGRVDDSQKGNISFLIGRIYFDDLHDYENAAAWYVRARAYDDKADYATEAAEKLVASLERMGHSFDAKRQLDNSANVVKPSPQAGDVTVAQIGNEPIYWSEIERNIQDLPPQAQQQLQSVDAKREFVRQYVGVELLYRAAKREGFEKDPDVLQRQDKVIKTLVVQKYLADKVFPELKLDTADVRNFYTANKEQYANKPFDSVKSQVLMDYQNQKADAAYGAYIEKLAKAEQVQFLDKNLK